MSAPHGIPAAAAGMSTRPSTRIGLLQTAGRLTRDRSFRNVLLLLFTVTAAHYSMELLPFESIEHLHHLPVMLYVFPIIYASVQCGRAGGILTGLSCAFVTLPNILLWHHESAEWLIELVQLTAAVVLGLVLFGPVEHEAVGRRLAEQESVRLTLINREITNAQEAERARIARELHDETAQALVLLAHRLDGVASTAGLPAAAREALYDVRAMTDTILTEVRQFSRDLRPSILDHLGLVPALDWLTADLTERATPAARLEVSGVPRRLPSETELAVFRIAQESLHNAERHSGASEAVVTLSFADEGLKLQVTDNGSGFDASTSPDELIHTGQLGIAGMFERAQLVGGRLTIDTAPGQGTCVSAAVPV